MTRIDDPLDGPAMAPVAPAATRTTAAHFGGRPPWSTRVQLPRWVVYPTVVFVVSRIVVMGAVWTALRIRPNPTHFDVLERWDGSWYVLAAEKGYSHIVPALQGGVGNAGQSTHAFFPMLPFLLRAGHALGLTYVSASLVVNLVAGIAAAVLLGRLVAELAGEDAAERAIVIFCCFPGAYVFTLIYAEGLLLALAIGCILALRHHQWILAGTLAAFATATRPNAIVLVACCAWEAFVFIRRADDRRRALIALAAPALSPIGVLAFMAFLWRRTGHAFVWLTVERRGWGQSFDLMYVVHRTSFVAHHPLQDLNTTVSVLGLVVILATGYLFVRTRPPVVLWIYTVGIVALSLGGNAFAHPRFIETAFPLVAAIGQRLRWPALSQVLSVSVATLVGLTMIFIATTLVVP